MRPQLRITNSSGFTIVEALVTLLTFSFFLIVFMVTLSYGFRTFSVAVARSDVTTEARRLVLFMENELRSTSYFSVSPEKREFNGRRRDGVCFVTIQDWSRPDSFNPTDGQPDWDSYLTYYATPDQPSGKLVRMSLSPTEPELVGGYPYSLFAAGTGGLNPLLPDDPLSYKGPDLSNIRVLATKVKSFSVSRVATTQEIEVKTVLRQNGIMTRRGDRRREGGTFELQYRVRPQNSK